jgi:hypothetical protein
MQTVESTVASSWSHGVKKMICTSLNFRINIGIAQAVPMDARTTWIGAALVIGVLLQALVAVRKADRCLPPAKERGLYLLKWWRIAAFTLLSLSQALVLALRWRWARDGPELPSAIHADSAALAAWGTTLVRKPFVASHNLHAAAHITNVLLYELFHSRSS